MSDHGPSCEPGLVPRRGIGPQADAADSAFCWVIPFAIDSGPANMALDQALMDQAREGGPGAFFRLYGWSAPTLSLGYFQRFEEIPPDLVSRGVPIVRRLTGGGAIWHDRELTYCLVLPRDHPRSRPSSALYRIVHGAIAEALGSVGVGVEQLGGGRPRTGVSGREFLCFADPCEHDLAVGGVKVTGSAQRRRDGVVMQHGSILLGASPLFPDLPGLAETRPGSAVPVEGLAERVTDRVSRSLGMTARPITPSEPLRLHARELERSLYRNPDWTLSRSISPHWGELGGRFPRIIHNLDD